MWLEVFQASSTEPAKCGSEAVYGLVEPLVSRCQLTARAGTQPELPQHYINGNGSNDDGSICPNISMYSHTH